MRAFCFAAVALTGIVLNPSFAQHRFTGVVYDSSTTERMPGAAISIIGTTEPVYCDKNGAFAFEVFDKSCTISAAFIGYKTNVETLHAGDTNRIFLQPEFYEDSKIHKVQAAFDAGYFGDVLNAPLGGIASLYLKSIGDTQVDFIAAYKHAEHTNSFRELTIAKLLPGAGIVPENIALSIKSMRYADFLLQEKKALLTNHLAFGLAIDAGISLSQLTIIGDRGPHLEKKYVSGIAGLSYLAGGYRLGDLYVFGQLNYNKGFHRIEAGIQSTFSLSKSSAIVLSGKYVTQDFPKFEGLMITARYPIFDTTHSCCYSRKVILRRIIPIR